MLYEPVIVKCCDFSPRRFSIEINKSNISLTFLSSSSSIQHLRESLKAENKSESVDVFITVGSWIIMWMFNDEKRCLTIHIYAEYITRERRINCIASNSLRLGSSWCLNLCCDFRCCTCYEAKVAWRKSHYFIVSQA